MTADRVIPLPPDRARAFERLAVAGVVVLLLGIFVAPQRAWASLLMASFGLVTIGLGGLFFIALQYVCGARWSIVLRRVPEAMTAALPWGALGLAAVVLVRPSLYPWYGAPGEHPGPGAGFMGLKNAWLSQPAFQARSAVYLTAWLVFALLIVRSSRRQDTSGALALTRRNVSLSTAFIVVFGVTFWLASIDWVMSLEPHWYSTMFGVYNFAGLFSSCLAAITILVVWLRWRGSLPRSITAAPLQDLGSLMVGFTTFWAYIWFCQFMLIWYANLPEETAYFARRFQGGWGILFVLNVAANWAAPFLLLLPLRSKRNPRVLVTASAIILAGRALDIYLMIAPPLTGGPPAFGLWELGALLATGGIVGASFVRALREAPIMPLRDPYLPLPAA